MKKYFILPVFVILLSLGKTMAQTYIPVATTGYSLDGVAENTTAVSTTGGALDASDFVLYSQFYGTLYSTGYGLPNNGTIVSGLRTYQLQSYTGFNVMHILAANADTLNFVTPAAFPSISLLGFGTQGAATASITVRFTDNSTQVFTPINMDDWFTANPSVYNGFDRVLRTTGSPALVGGAGNPRMFGIDLAILCANQGKLIKRIIIKNNSASAQICVMAVAGNPPSYPVAANPTVVCSGATSTLSASGLTTYTWQAVGLFPGSNAATVAVSPASTTIYTLTGDNAGCPTYTTVTVNVSNGLPTISFAGSSQSICLGAPATITASGALTYTLSSPAANGATFAPVATAVYTVTGANGCGSNTQTISIVVSPLIVTASTPTALVCAGFPGTVIAAGATNYTWMPGSNTQTNYIVSPAANTIYTVTGKTGNCAGTATIGLSITPVPTLAIAISNSTICDGDQVTLNVTGNAITYTWNASAGNSTNTTINLTPPQSTVFIVTGSNATNCTGTAQQILYVNPNPTVVASTVDNTVCVGGTAGLTASGAISYSWNGTAGGPATFVNPLTTTVYTLTGGLPTGCMGSGTVVVNVFSPTISISPNMTICPGGVANLNAGSAVSYTWSNNLGGLGSVIVSPSVNTVFSVVALVDNQSGVICPATNSVQVSIAPSPTITVVSNRANNTICHGETAILTSSGAGSSGTYTWSGGVSAANSPTVSVLPINTQTYIALGKDNNGCKSTGQLVLKVVTCTGIETQAVNAAGISVYPNPSHDLLNIKSETAVDITIVSELGQTIQSLKLNEANNYHVIVEGLSSGIYFVTSTNNNAVFRQKIVITR